MCTSILVGCCIRRDDEHRVGAEAGAASEYSTAAAVELLPCRRDRALPRAVSMLA